MTAVQAPAVAAERPALTASLPPVNEEPSLFSLQGGDGSSADLGLSPHSMLHGMRPMMRQGTPAADAAAAAGSKPLLPPDTTRKGDVAEVLREIKDTARPAAALSSEAAEASSSGGGSLAYVLTPIDNTISQW